MASSDPAPSPAPEARGFDGVSHGYAPDGRPAAAPPVSLDKIVGDVVENLSATAKAELALLEARGELALHGASWAAAWSGIAACALGVGPLLATLIVVAVLLGIAALAAWRARRSYGDIRTALRRDLAGERGDD